MSCSDLAVVIPVKDEEEGLPLVLEELFRAGVEAGRVIVVDGGSRDRTVEVARKYGVIVVSQKYPGGKAGGVKDGIEASKSRYVIVMDGDATYPGYRVWDFCRKLEEGYDMVIGVRRPEPRAMNPVFAFGNKLLTFWFNLNFGTKLRDVLSGMYAIRVEALSDAEWVARVFEENNVILAYLFGSRARGSWGEDSDYDIAVLFGRPDVSVIDEIKLAMKLARELKVPPDKVDVVAVDKADTILKARILKEGIPIYEKSREFRVKWERREYLEILRQTDLHAIYINSRLQHSERLRQLRVREDREQADPKQESH
ncbi:MAG: glycosyltransferase [Thermoprotei archaeon]|nr:glycosyltransferase [Thermoprotei archaeon]